MPSDLLMSRARLLTVAAAALTLAAALSGLPATPADRDHRRPSRRRMAVAPPPSAYAGTDPRSWSAHRLAAQLVFSSSTSATSTPPAGSAPAGIGGIALLGSRPPSRLRARLAAARRAARTPCCRSWRATRRAGPCSGCATSSTRCPRPGHGRLEPGPGPPDGPRLRRPDASPRCADGPRPRGRPAGARCRTSPAAPRLLRRPRPGRRRAQRLWRLRHARRRCRDRLKHWPGHGSATNSHTGPARVAPLAELEQRDLRTFGRELADGAPVVMVGHLLSRGLTTGGVPTSLSPHALRYLRRTAGPDVVC